MISVDAPIEVAAKANASATWDLDRLFVAQYERLARLIARIVRDHGRAEELAVEVFLKLWESPQARRACAEGWLYRTAVRAALNELRAQARRSRYERLSNFLRASPTPEEIASSVQEQHRVRTVLGAMKAGHAELLLLRNQGLSYEELASALNLNPASVGTLLSRAQQAFRKEYQRRYGTESPAGEGYMDR